MNRRKQQGLVLMMLIVTLIVAAAIGGIGWYIWRHRQAAPGTASTQPAYQNDGWNKTVTSGKGAYSITFPDGWHVARDTNSDSFMISGEAQPEIKAGTSPVITSEVFGSDGPIILFIWIAKDDTPVPPGTAMDFTLENGKTNPTQGKKYVYEYPADTTGEGLGGQRAKGDRDYTYSFDIGGGKHLRVSYSVYASDPRNNVHVIDELVRTIRLN